ncbi:carboxypeptidase B1-like [Malaya genurostris]|uniref:carboxypeptidase B1-like n=1 Tax=Malaya genurostris TaxID=325434 RepID=UPI0026F38984|nr:carboxypeptidase B1-like [Malaya genurostris]
MRSLIVVLCLAVLVLGKPNLRHTISWDHFWTQEEIEEYMHELVEEYPDIATLETVGTSTEGRDIDAILVSYGTNANKPLVIIDAGLRAREWVSPMVGMFVLHELVEHPDEFTDILQAVNFLVIPLVNPDGYVYSHETDRNWIKTRSSSGNGCYGVDLNRNFDYEWGTVGVSSDPCDDAFPGLTAFSEPEARAVRDTVSNYATNLKLYLSIQAAAKMVVYPFSYNGLRTPSNDHNTVAQMVARAMMGENGYIYTYGAAGIQLPVESGTVSDYVAGTFEHEYTFVLETRGGTDNEYELPADKLSEVLYETAAGLKVLGEYVAGIRSLE